MDALLDVAHQHEGDESKARGDPDHRVGVPRQTGSNDDTLLGPQARIPRATGAGQGSARVHGGGTGVRQGSVLTPCVSPGRDRSV